MVVNACQGPQGGNRTSGRSSFNLRWSIRRSKDKIICGRWRQSMRNLPGLVHAPPWWRDCSLPVPIAPSEDDRPTPRKCGLRQDSAQAGSALDIGVPCPACEYVHLQKGIPISVVKRRLTSIIRPTNSTVALFTADFDEILVACCTVDSRTSLAAIVVVELLFTRDHIVGSSAM